MMKEFNNCNKLIVSKLLLHAGKQNVAFQTHNVTTI